MVPAAHQGPPPPNPSPTGTRLWGTPGATSLWLGEHIWQGRCWAAYSPATGPRPQFSLLSPRTSLPKASSTRVLPSCSDSGEWDLSQGVCPGDEDEEGVPARVGTGHPHPEA